MKRKRLAYYLFVGLVLVSMGVFSQGRRNNPPHPNGNGQGGPPKPELAIDGGLSYLFMAGIAYGVFAIRKRKTELNK